MVGKLMDASCADFSQQLAAKVSVPGGGGAAALAGALGIALGTMAGNFTVGKKAYADVEPQVKDLIWEGENLRQKLLSLADADAEAFEPLSEAYGIPRDNPERARILEEATVAALQAPLEMVRLIARALDLLSRMEQVSSKLLLSDVGCGAALCAAALEMAALNVYVNTKTLQDRAYAQAVNDECDELLRTHLDGARQLCARVTSALKEGE